MSEQNFLGHGNTTCTVTSEETKEEGCFNFLRKKGEKAIEDCVMTDDNEEKKHTLMDKLQRTHTHSSSSSEEEVEEEAGERKKKKKKRDLKEANNNEKIMCGDEGEETKGKDTGIPVEKRNEEEKKGFLEKIKEKLPGQHKKNTEEDIKTPPACEHSPGSDAKEKKGLIDKIKEKLPGHHKSNENIKSNED